MDLVKSDPTFPVSLPTRAIPVVEVSSNISQRVIEITEDKVRNILTPLVNENAKAKWDNWIGRGGILLTLLTSLAAATRDASLFGVGGDTLRGIYIAASIAAFVWLLFSFVKPRNNNIDFLIAYLKGNQIKE